MDYSKYALKHTPEPSKPPINSSISRKIPIKETTRHPIKCRTSSISVKIPDSRATSASPSRICIPLYLVSSSNTNIPIHIQKKLLSNSSQRTQLAGSIKSQNTLKSPKQEFQLEKQSFDSNMPKVQNFVENTKECTFGLHSFNKENNYVKIYNKQKSIKEKQRGSSEEVIKCISRLKTADGSLKKAKKPVITELNSVEIEARYKKITSKLNQMSENIEKAIAKENY